MKKPSVPYCVFLARTRNAVFIHFPRVLGIWEMQTASFRNEIKSFYPFTLTVTNHHHHHVVSLARISLTLSRYFSLSFIAFGRSSGLYLVSSHSCCMYVRAGRPAFAWPYAGVHWSTSQMSSSLLLQLCPACLANLNCIVFVVGSKWPSNWCLVGCCHQDLFIIALNILVLLPSSFVSRLLASK